MNTKFLSFIFLVFATGICIIEGRTVAAVYKTCGGIQMAIDLASVGDTVKLTKGEYVISKTIDVKSGISIIGEGKDNTILRHSVKRNDEFWIFRVDGANQSQIRFSSFSIIGKSPVVSPGILFVNGAENFRVDHCKFIACSRRAIEIHGISRGVIDHNVFKENWYTAIVIYGDGNRGWKNTLTLGDSNAVFVEDNYFEQDKIPDISMAHHIASNNGSHYVFRYNVIKDGKIASHAIDAHGNKYGSERGSRSYEIYNNTIYADHRWAGINIRGGDGVIFGNKFSGEFVSPVHLMHEGRDGDGECAYPCIDQIRELYIWNNVYNGKKVDVFIRFPQIIKRNRDFFLIKKPGYTSFRYPHPLVK